MTGGGARKAGRSEEASPKLRLGRLDQLLGYHLRRAQAAVFQHFAATVGTAAVTPGQLGVLAIIEANSGLSQSRLGAALGIDRSTVVGVIDRLETRGLVLRESAPHDRRSHALKLSAAGTALLRQLEKPLSGHEQHVARTLTAPESRQLIELLKRVAAALE